MPYLQDYGWDIFLSYAQSDDTPGQQGKWISAFQKRLGDELRDRLGRPVGIHFDIRDLEHNDKLDKILENVGRSALFVAIGSPSYVHSDWCRSEAETFGEKCRRCDRMFIAEKFPLRDGMTYPGPLSELLRAQFWNEDQATRIRQTLPHRSTLYNNRLVKLVENIVDCLLELEKEPPGERVDPLIADRPEADPPETDPPGTEPPGTEPSSALPSCDPAPARRQPAVYIAYGADDVQEEREQLRAYLEDDGIKVLPAPFLKPGSTERYLEAVKAGLDEATIFAQLLGQRPAQGIEDLPEGDTYHQYREAAARPHLDCHFWRPEALDPAAVTDARYRELLDRGQAWGPREFMKTIQRAARTEKTGPPPGAPPLIFISANCADDAYANELFDACERKQLDVARASPADPEELRRQFADADSVTLVYGKTEDAWLTNQHIIFRRARALRTSPMGPVPLILCIGPPVEPGKRPPISSSMMRKVDVREKWSVEPFERLLDEVVAQ